MFPNVMRCDHLVVMITLSFRKSDRLVNMIKEKTVVVEAAPNYKRSYFFIFK